MKIEFGLGDVGVPEALAGPLVATGQADDIVAACAGAPELERVAGRYGRYLQTLGTLALGSVLVILGMLVIGGNDPARWYVIGAAVGLAALFPATMLLYRRRMQATFTHLLQRRLDELQS